MKVINTYEAKTHLSKYLEQVAGGKQIVIGRGGRPVALLIPYQPSVQTRQPGSLKGRIKIASDFDQLPPQVADALQQPLT